MKNIRSLSDTQLLSEIRVEASNERRSGLAVIHRLREIARRRLDAQLGYSSLHKFCMEELKYSSGSAWRRVNSMNALQELPELEARIEQGDLTLASVSQVQSFCNQQKKSPEEKKEILEQVAGLSKRATEQVLAKIAPLPERPEKLKPLNQTSSELRITLDSDTLAALEKVRDLIAHSHPGASYAQVIGYLAKLGLKKLDPSAPKKTSKNPVSPPGEKSDPIPLATRREVWRRDGSRCGYRCPESGRVCGATRLLQIDHIILRARGGSNELSNLRLRCRRHNLLTAIQELGAAKMKPYLRSRAF